MQRVFFKIVALAIGVACLRVGFNLELLQLFFKLSYLLLLGKRSLVTVYNLYKDDLNT